MRDRRMLAWLLVVAWGCAADDATSPMAVRELTEDGIRVLESVTPAWDDGNAWTIDPQPSVEIGVAEGADHDMLGEPHGARFLTDGSIVVADGGSNDVRIFDESGVFVTRAGRAGSGPCEFAMIGEALPAADASLVVPDIGSRGRVALMGGRGECLGTRSIQVPEHAASEALGRFPDGDLLVGAWSFPGERPAAEAAPAWTEMTLFRLPWEGDPRPLAVVPSREGGEGFHFASRAAFAAGVDRLYSTDGERYSVDARDGDGLLLLRMRRADLPPPVSDADIERFRDKARDNIRAFGRDEGALARLAEARFADRYPGYRRLLVDEAGNVWAQLYRGPSEELPFVYPGRPFDEQRLPAPDLVQWDVYDPAGRWLGTVPLASSRHLADVGREAALTVGMDSDGVFRVWVHDLRRGTDA